MSQKEINALIRDKMTQILQISYPASYSHNMVSPNDMSSVGFCDDKAGW